MTNYILNRTPILLEANTEKQIPFGRIVYASNSEFVIECPFFDEKKEVRKVEFEIKNANGHSIKQEILILKVGSNPFNVFSDNPLIGDEFFFAILKSNVAMNISLTVSEELGTGVDID